MDTPATATPTQRLAASVLGEDLAVYVERKRKVGRSWRLISRDLYLDSKRELDISEESLRQWYGDKTQGAA